MTSLKYRNFVIIACVLFLASTTSDFAWGNLRVVAVQGDDSPDGNGRILQTIPGGLVLDIPVVNDVGEATFLASLFETSGVGQDNSALFRGDGRGNLTLIAREGQSAPNGDGQLGELLNPAPFVTRSLAVNNNGEVLFLANIAGSSTSDPQDVGVFVGDGTQALETLARVGQTAPGAGLFRSFGNPIDFHDNGVTALAAGLQGLSPGVYRLGGPLPDAEIARQGQPVPNTTETYSSNPIPLGVNQQEWLHSKRSSHPTADPTAKRFFSLMASIRSKNLCGDKTQRPPATTY